MIQIEREKEIKNLSEKVKQIKRKNLIEKRNRLKELKREIKNLSEKEKE